MVVEQNSVVWVRLGGFRFTVSTSYSLGLLPGQFETLGNLERVQVQVDWTGNNERTVSEATVCSRPICLDAIREEASFLGLQGLFDLASSLGELGWVFEVTGFNWR